MIPSTFIATCTLPARQPRSRHPRGWAGRRGSRCTTHQRGDLNRPGFLEAPNLAKVGAVPAIYARLADTTIRDHWQPTDVRATRHRARATERVHRSAKITTPQTRSNHD